MGDSDEEADEDEVADSLMSDVENSSCGIIDDAYRVGFRLCLYDVFQRQRAFI